MRAFLTACFIAVVIATSAAAALNVVQRLSSGAFAATSVRL
jgi:hypothetical protein